MDIQKLNSIDIDFEYDKEINNVAWEISNELSGLKYGVAKDILEAAISYLNDSAIVSRV